MKSGDRVKMVKIFRHLDEDLAARSFYCEILIDVKAGHAEYCRGSLLTPHLLKGRIQMQQNNAQAAEQPEKKVYVAPKLTRHGKVEEMTLHIPNPSPSQGF